MDYTPDCVLVTQGATQALDLVMRSELAAGDTVLVEEPGYFMLFPMLDRLGVCKIGIPRLPAGPDLDAVERACRIHQPKAFFVQPVLHNPTGQTATASCLHRLLGIAARYGLTLIEDDVYCDLHSDQPVRLAQLASGDDQVIYLSSFTKLLGPAARIGFVAASRARVGALLQAKILSTLTGSACDELLLAEMLASGQYRRFLDRLRSRLATARALATRSLVDLGFDVAAAAAA